MSPRELGLWPIDTALRLVVPALVLLVIAAVAVKQGAPFFPVALVAVGAGAYVGARGVASLWGEQSTGRWYGGAPLFAAWALAAFVFAIPTRWKQRGEPRNLRAVDVPAVPLDRFAHIESLPAAVVPEPDDQELTAENEAKPNLGDLDLQAARSLFNAGTIAFRQRRFEDALANVSQAHKLTMDPVLLFDIGLTYERLFRLPEAIKALEDYLAAMPDAPNRPATEERLRAMRAQVGGGPHVAAPGPSAPELDAK